MTGSKTSWATHEKSGQGKKRSGRHQKDIPFDALEKAIEEAIANTKMLRDNSDEAGPSIMDYMDQKIEKSPNSGARSLACKNRESMVCAMKGIATSKALERVLQRPFVAPSSDQWLDSLVQNLWLNERCHFGVFPVTDDYKQGWIDRIEGNISNAVAAFVKEHRVSFDKREAVSGP